MFWSTNLEKFGKISVITAVYELQIVEKVPYNENDTKVNYIVITNEIMKL